MDGEGAVEVRIVSALELEVRDGAGRLIDAVFALTGILRSRLHGTRGN